jgi:uncharacterized protein YjdB
MRVAPTALSAVIVAVAILAGCESKPVVVEVPIIEPPETVLTVIPDTVTLLPGDTRQLVAVISGTTNQAASWTSSDSAIVSVQPTSGLVLAVAPGTAVVTAASVQVPRKRDSSSVRVLARNP